MTAWRRYEETRTPGRVRLVKGRRVIPPANATRRLAPGESGAGAYWLYSSEMCSWDGRVPPLE